ncbi:hypothetical protein D0Z03_001318 [Geotrichum reessii]|nr:hypothetical protein D0Z03_001318 [Galactomyces reessii]
MGFVTAKYDGNLTPLISTQLGVNTLVRSYNGPDHVQKYVATLFNEVSWVIYVTVPNGDDFSLSINQDTGEIAGNSKSKVTIQVAVLPDNTESYYDQAAGLYPTSAKLSGSVSGTDSAFFSINYNTEGYSTSGSTLIHALPHHVESLTDSTSSKLTSIKLDTTTKGVATGYLTNSLEFYYKLNQKIQFLPTTDGSPINLSADALKKIANSANADLSDDFNAQTNLDSTYFAGKGFDKLAYILLVVNDILGDADVSKETLDRIKSVFTLFTDNKQINPLMYDTLLKGITSTAAQGGNTGTDFGSPYYNDHHFHYGYFIHAAAVIGYVDKQQGGTWAEDNKAWVNALVRDVANPSSDDGYFPVFRSFDWYNGHSWAKGLFASSDGKDEESTSEDYNFAYGMKLWGKIIKDGSMEARGDLMLSILAKSLDSYFYFKEDNTVQPAQIIGNCIPGITFENKLDYTTYFGTNREYIHGIHMIPLTPVSNYMRTPEFAQHEWNIQNLSGLADSLGSGWRGILKSNQAIFDPVSSYNFFAQDNFSSDWIDGGASKTWYLAYTAALGGSTGN